MTRLELITMPSLTSEQARLLLDQYVEGSLDSATAHDVEQALRDDDALADEFVRLKETMRALRALPALATPADLAQKVRAALHAAPTLGPISPEEAVHGIDAPSNQVIEAPVDNVIRGRFGRRAIEWGVSAAAAAALIVGVGVASGLFETSETKTAPGVEAAGLGATDHQMVQLQAPTALLAESDRVLELARTAGLTMANGSGHADEMTWIGSAQAAKRFSLALRQHAQELGGDVLGFVPATGQVRLSLRPMP